MKHELKCWPEFFQALWCGDKTFEIRKNDRYFKERDEIVIREYALDPTGVSLEREFTGREIEGFIIYLTNFEQKPGFVVFSFRESCRRE